MHQLLIYSHIIIYVDIYVGSYYLYLFSISCHHYLLIMLNFIYFSMAIILLSYFYIPKMYCIFLIYFYQLILSIHSIIQNILFIFIHYNILLRQMNLLILIIFHPMSMWGLLVIIMIYSIFLIFYLSLLLQIIHYLSILFPLYHLSVHLPIIFIFYNYPLHRIALFYDRTQHLLIFYHLGYV